MAVEQISNQNHQEGCLEALFATDVPPMRIRNKFWGLTEENHLVINHGEQFLEWKWMLLFAENA